MKTMDWLNRKKLPDHSGFSLVEIMMVICLIGILAGITGPPMFKHLEANHMQNCTDRMVADMQYARAIAIATGKTHRFTCTLNSYSLTNLGTNIVVRQVNFDHGATLALAQSVDFYPWGMADALDFDLTLNDMDRTIQILPTGMVEVIFP